MQDGSVRPDRRGRPPNPCFIYPRTRQSPHVNNGPGGALHVLAPATGRRRFECIVSTHDTCLFSQVSRDQILPHKLRVTKLGGQKVNISVHTKSSHRIRSHDPSGISKLRKSVFHDRLRWQVNCFDAMEYDAFEGDTAQSLRENRRRCHCYMQNYLNSAANEPSIGSSAAAERRSLC
ncbi:acyl-homoserine-lactone synthase [Rhizobium sp. CECT 9324]|uniref:acyl-homoserine-lactone synthase n=1 Tax=Rhizobium sp. CECT 9324 TaxID=2845820 RepID=UPI0033A4812E